jgi:two-component system copper resistance phosphate regulon response regulator CusR
VRILLAEDEQGLRDVIVQGLAKAGYQVDTADRGDDAIDQLKWYEYDVAVLDWNMPGVDGLEVVRWVRRHERPTAIIMLTARDEPDDRVEGLDAGADDYLVKPFDFGELLARIRALQRRPRAVDPPILTVGRLSLDPASRVVTADGRPVSLTPTEYQVLEVLMRRVPSVVDRDSIAMHAWADETDTIGTNTIEVQMSRLRAKLAGAQIRIKAVRGVGYRLEAR